MCFYVLLLIAKGYDSLVFLVPYKSYIKYIGHRTLKKNIFMRVDKNFNRIFLIVKQLSTPSKTYAGI